MHQLRNNVKSQEKSFYAETWNSPVDRDFIDETLFDYSGFDYDEYDSFEDELITSIELVALAVDEVVRRTVYTYYFKPRTIKEPEPEKSNGVNQNTESDPACNRMIFRQEMAQISKSVIDLAFLLKDNGLDPSCIPMILDPVYEKIVERYFRKRRWYKSSPADSINSTMIGIFGETKLAVALACAFNKSQIIQPELLRTSRGGPFPRLFRSDFLLKAENGVYYLIEAKTLTRAVRQGFGPLSLISDQLAQTEVFLSPETYSQWDSLSYRCYKLYWEYGIEAVPVLAVLNRSYTLPDTRRIVYDYGLQ